jgi:transposase
VRNAGMTFEKISTIVGISKSSVHRALERFEERGDFHDRRRSGRPKKLNNRNIRMLKRLTENEGRYSSRETRIRLNNSLKNPVCRRTVVNYLHQCGYEYKTRIKKLFLTKQHKKMRLDWCLEHSNWTTDDWKRVIFSEETTFYLFKRKNEVKIRRAKDDRWREGCMRVAAAGGGGRVNFWGAITSKGTGCFRIYTEYTNTDVYCNILESYLIPTVQLYGMENNYLPA